MPGPSTTDAATGNPRVKALVYADAFEPAENETLFPLPGADSTLLYSTQRPPALSVGNEAPGVPAYPSIPSWYLVGTKERAITPVAQRFRAERAGLTTVDVSTGHLSLISRPGAVEDVIVTAARVTR